MRKTGNSVNEGTLAAVSVAVAILAGTLLLILMLKSNTRPDKSGTSLALGEDSKLPDVLFILSPVTNKALDEIRDFLDTAASEKRKVHVYMMFHTMRCGDAEAAEWADSCRILGCEGENVSKDCGNIFPNNFNQYASDVSHYYFHETDPPLSQQLRRLLSAPHITTYTYPTQLMKNPRVPQIFRRMLAERVYKGDPVAPSGEDYRKLSVGGKYYVHWIFSKGGRHETIFDVMVVWHAIHSLTGASNELTEGLTPVPVSEEDVRIEGTVQTVLRKSSAGHAGDRQMFAMVPTEHFGTWLEVYATDLVDSFVEKGFADLIKRIPSLASHVKRMMVVQDFPDGDNVLSLQLLQRVARTVSGSSLVVVSHPSYHGIEEKWRGGACFATKPELIPALNFASVVTSNGDEWPHFKDPANSTPSRICDPVAGGWERDAVMVFMRSMYQDKFKNVIDGDFPRINVLNHAIYPPQTLPCDQFLHNTRAPTTRSSPFHPEVCGQNAKRATLFQVADEFFKKKNLSANNMADEYDRLFGAGSPGQSPPPVRCGPNRNV